MLPAQLAKPQSTRNAGDLTSEVERRCRCRPGERSAWKDSSRRAHGSWCRNGQWCIKRNSSRCR